ncbi:MAG: hypothetical protein LQ352_006760 [Teloschistes flavicans]|nr:MAG: hypothetical protein LQ352_006760 [Teloschistes flavicans]
MPTFYPKSLNIRLSVADIVKTSTADPVKSLCPEGIVKKDRALDQFKRDAETPIPVNDDEFRLSFIGKHKDRPLVMVHVEPKYLFGTASPIGKSRSQKPAPLVLDTEVADAYDSPLSELGSSPLSPFPTSDDSEPRADGAIGEGDQNMKRAPIAHRLDGTRDNDDADLSWTGTPGQQQRSNASDPQTPEPIHGLMNRLSWPHRDPSVHTPYCEDFGPPSPQALCLRVMPGERAFCSIQDPENGRWCTNDLKFDVFLDGELCTSTSVSKHMFSTKEKSRVICSGARIGQVIEKPWSLMPHARDVPGDLSRSSSEEDAAKLAEKRWDEISKNLVLAAELSGRSTDDELPALGQYLQSLASIEMPAALPGMLITKVTGFAVIDVVVSTGLRLTKDNSNPYLRKPTRMSIRTFRSEKNVSASKELVAVSQDRESHRGKSKADEQIAKQPYFLHYVPRGNPGRSARKSTGDNKKTFEPSGTPEVNSLFGKLILTKQNGDVSTSRPLAPKSNQSPALAPPSCPRKAPMPGPRERRSVPMAEVTEPTSTAIPRKRNASIMSSFPAAAATTAPRGPPALLKKASSERAKKPRMAYHYELSNRRTSGEEWQAIVKEAEKDAQRRTTRSETVNSGKEVKSAEMSTQASAMMSRAMEQPHFKKPSARKSSLGGPRKQPVQAASFSDPFTSKSPTATNTSTARNNPLPSAGDADPSSEKLISSTSSQRNSVPNPTSNESSPDKPLIHRYRRPTKIDPRTPQPIKPVTPAPPPASSSLASTPQLQPKSSAKSSPVRKDQIRTSTSASPVTRPTPWEVPQISRHSIVSYPDGDMVRQTKAQKKACFREDGVVVGVRFIVG